ENKMLKTALKKKREEVAILKTEIANLNKSTITKLTPTTKPKTKTKTSCVHCSGTTKMSCQSCLIKGVPTGLGSCSSCEGVGRIKCSRCQGKYSRTCSGCRGRGKTKSGSRTGMGGATYPTYSRCYSCSGLGKIICYTCKRNGGKGFSLCTQCKGKKKSGSCYSCQGDKFIKCKYCSKLKNVKPTSILSYTFEQIKVAGSMETDIRKTKVINEARKKIKFMLNESFITLTYPILNVTVENGVRLSVGYPLELMSNYADRQLRIFSFELSDDEALAIRKGSKLVLTGKASLCNLDGTPFSKVKGGLVVLSEQRYGYSSNSFYPIISGLHLKKFTFTLDGKEVKFIK
ncbi:hypothetical protein HN662_01485, partial [Candidatus Woesearchaeota archaeon]|nr:hypothetical protein [Candidatus Woesearchaeota archaeon]